MSKQANADVILCCRACLFISSVSRILIDTGEGVPAWSSNLRALLSEHGCTSLSAILLTHWHHDHTGGLVDAHSLLASPPHTSPAASIASDHSNTGIFKSHGARFLPSSLMAQLPSLGLSADSIRPIVHGQQFTAEGATLIALATPGHTEDHTSFLLQEEGSIFSGDTILGAGTSVFNDLHSYLHSLRLIHSHRPQRIYPAHGPIIDGGEAPTRIEQYIAHRAAREQQIVQTLEAKQKESVAKTVGKAEQREVEEEHLTALEIVQRICTDTYTRQRALDAHANTSSSYTHGCSQFSCLLAVTLCVCSCAIQMWIWILHCFLLLPIMCYCILPNCRRRTECSRCTHRQMTYMRMQSSDRWHPLIRMHNQRQRRHHRLPQMIVKRRCQ